MTTIIEAAVQALREMDIHRSITADYGHRFTADTILAAAQEAAGTKPCPACNAKTEEWWSYCAMCGYHIAAGASE